MPTPKTQTSVSECLRDLQVGENARTNTCTQSVASARALPTFSTRRTGGRPKVTDMETYLMLWNHGNTLKPYRGPHVFR